MAKNCRNCSYWHGLRKSKQPGKGDPKKNKSYHALLQNHTNPLVPLYFKFFESIAAKLNGFLRRFQSDAPMVPFLVNTLEEITREFCSKFILDEVMGNSTNTIQLIKIDVFDINKQKVNVDLGFAIKEEINLMKKNGKIKETKLMQFYKAVKKFLATLCNHLLTKTPLQYQFSRCCRCLNPQSYEVTITQKLIKCVKESHTRYVNDLAERKKKSLNEERSKNLESLNESIRTLHQKKNLLESTIEDLEKASDEYAFKAEDGIKLTSVKQLITKSNALKRAASEKHVELDQCLKETKKLMDKKKDV